jgi:diketogulonate reductase-like aldo/keto reductase
MKKAAGRWLCLLDLVTVIPSFRLSAVNPMTNKRKRTFMSSSPAAALSNYFHPTTAAQAKKFTDGALIGNDKNGSPVVLPYLGFGTYRLGKDQTANAATLLRALESGYRVIDTAFVYGGEKTEKQVGQAIQKAIDTGIVKNRSQVFVTTKHWRKHHGYDATLLCLDLSLKRLALDHVDLYLMHWPGPAYTTMHRKKEAVQLNPWHYASTAQQDMVKLRSDTWRAMEDAYRQGKVRAIGVSNMTIQHLQKLKKTATIWPPAVNQVELHPLHPQKELLEYCHEEGIVVQAYASLGGQDTGKARWKILLRQNDQPLKKNEKLDLLHAEPVTKLASSLNVTPAQLLLRWGLQRGCTLIPKTTSQARLEENAGIFDFEIPHNQVDALQEELLQLVRENNPEQTDIQTLTRLCWRTDPLRQLDFE